MIQFYFLVIVLLAPPLAYAESLFSYGGEIDFNSRYVWRGIPLSEKSVLQPSVWLSSKDFTFDVWTNIDATNEADRKRLNEVDTTLSFKHDIGKFNLEPSFLVYMYPNQTDSSTTGELALKVSYALEPFSLYTNQIVDVIEYKGAYFGEFGLSFARDLISKISLESHASMGVGSSRFNKAYLGPSINALNLFSTDVSVIYSPVEHFSLKPHAGLTALINGELRNQVDDATIVVGGLAIDAEW